MVENPLAFDFSKTRTICVAFDEAWAFLQGLGSDHTDASKSFASRTILAKRIIEMADQGLMDVTELRDDALAFLQHNPPFLRDRLGGGLRMPKRHPACRRREAQPGSCTERENLTGDAKGKGASGYNREAESTDAPERGGLLRISDEAG